jgi:hypothetical protein
MRTLYKILFVFLAITGATTILFNYTDIKFGSVDFYINHGWVFLIAMTIFPRITLFVSGFIFHSIEIGGLIWWLGFFFTPRLLIAILATISYWNTNQLLVIISWLIALGGESSEKFVISKRMQPTKKYQNYEGTTIDAEFKVKE